MKKYLDLALAKKASDLVLAPGNKPALRINGEIVASSETPLSGDEINKIALSIASEQALARIDAEGVASIGIALDDGTIARVNISRSRGSYSIGVRFHSGRIHTLKECGVPDAVRELLNAPNGIIAVSGPTGSGKTTTLLSMLDWINENKALHICTIEQRAVSMITPKKSVVQQREVGVDVSSMAAGINAALHQDMDVIMVGEVDNFETVTACLNAAETGHLVIVQLHASSSSDAIQRLTDAVPEFMQASVKQRVAQFLRGVIFQVLARNEGKGGRSAIYEVMVVDDVTRADIVAGKETLRPGKGSVSLRDELARFEREKTVRADDIASIRAAFVK